MQQQQLPQWMRQAINEAVISEAEAREMHRLCLASKEDLVPMPEHLWPACERIHLWETPAAPGTH